MLRHGALSFLEGGQKIARGAQVAFLFERSKRRIGTPQSCLQHRIGIEDNGETHLGESLAAWIRSLRRIAELYAIERSIKGRTADVRRHVRNISARPLIEMMKPWLEMELGRVPPAGPLAEAIRYALARWPALTRFLDDGRVELDNNPVERAIRPIALGRKNHLFAGSDSGGVRWATVCSLIATANLNNVEPFAYLRNVLQRMTNGHPASRLDELLPWNWQPSAKA